MRHFVFSPPCITPADLNEDLAVVLESMDAEAESAAEAALSAWARLESVHEQLCRAGDALVQATIAHAESAEAVAEASLTLRYQAHMLGEIEYLDEIDADTLVQALLRIDRARPPERLEALHERLMERVRVWHDDREAVIAAGLHYRRCGQLHQREYRRFVERRLRLRHAVRRVVISGRAA
ncbi:MAG: hypothetical protein JST54_20125 [Deltaproteobacteria bacterium]|nr:hypothetical protein [Deltaproteobacteria bacterium]